MDKKPKKDQSPSSHSSGPHRLQLDEELSRNSPKEVESAKERYTEAQASCPPSAVPPSMESGAVEVKEMSDAATKLTESVDKVCEALVMVFGKISDVSDEAHGQTLVLRSVMRLMIVLAVVQGIVLAVSIYMVSHTVNTTKAIEQTQKSRVVAIQKLNALTVRMEKLIESAEKTEKVVTEVKKEADEKPTVELAPDPKKPGGAVVRIVPPKTPPKAPPPDPEGVKTSPPKKPPPPKSTGVEIPIKVDEARTPTRDAEPRQ